VNATQTLWTDVLATALADAGVAVCVVSPGSRSTPLVAALARSRRFELPVIIDERAAGFFALSAARSGGRPVALVCTSGSAPGHYLPAVIEAAMAHVPLLVISADRPPELQDAGASQTVPQGRLYGDQVRAAIDLGPPSAEPLAMRAVRRRVIQAVTCAGGPVPGPVHVNVPLRKPLEPVMPSTEAERALAAEVSKIAALPVAARPPLLAAPGELIDELAAALCAEPRGLIVAGALPEAFAAARDDLFALAAVLGYPLFAEAGSQLRLGPRPAAGEAPGFVALDNGDLILAARFAGCPPPRLLLQLGAEPVAPGWHAAQPLLAGCARWSLAAHWQDPTSTARVLLGDPVTTVRRLRAAVEARVAGAGATRDPQMIASYLEAEAKATAQLAAAIAAHPRTEVELLAAALVACAQVAARNGAARAPRLLLGNSLPVRVIDQAATQAALPCFLPVATQRGAAGIDGLIAGAAGAALSGDGRPVLALIGDVTFAHDAGSLQVLAAARTPVVVLVIDNGGGRIFDHLPVARAELGDEVYPRFFTTAPRLDPAAIARAFGVRAQTLASERGDDVTAATVAAIVAALTTPGATLLHVPVAADGALAVRAAALRGMQPQLRIVQGATS
jgi:2-succinyl-5-enolpyruvyl-6-hydroxy-3-cyclohexene-1-carboxylate synthase